MTIYFLDTNFILRFLLQDNEKQYTEAKEKLLEIDTYKTKAKITSEILMEVEYLLRKFYNVPRKAVAEKLLQFIDPEWIETEKKDVVVKSLKKYPIINIDLVDIVLFYQALEEKGQILSFDKDFKKLIK